MKVIAKDIECIAWFTKDGIKPLKFRYENVEGENIVVKVDKIITIGKEKLCGNIVFVFECQSEIDSIVKLFQLKYFVEECRWLLFKI